MLGINLDLVLVPTGIIFMVGYHIYLVYRIIKHPNSTVIGFENGNRRVWVQQMMEVSIIKTDSVGFLCFFYGFMACFFLILLGF
jgi:hypothetical protein